MLNVLTSPAQRFRFCDGLSRRSFLQIGSLAVSGFSLSLPKLLRAEADGVLGLSNKSVIMVYLSGGIAHQDTVDLKPDAPDGVRGEFKPIPSKVPGIELGELLPKLANCTDKLAIIRSVVGQVDEHSSFQSLTGHTMGQALQNGWPNFGSVISQLMGPKDAATPAFVDLFPTMQHRPYNSPPSGLVGPTFRGIRADGEDLESMKLRFVDASRFSTRRHLLDSIDGIQRNVDSLALAGMDTSYQKAFDVLTSSRLVDALDVEKEDPTVRERYGRGSSKHLGDGAPMWNDQLLQARRLIEAGVRCVAVAYGFWDTHGSNFGYLKQHLPLFDQGISALIEDIYARGLDRDVTVIVWGEFGRTPKINKDAGRDHWPRVNSAILAGGSMRVGQVIGATDKLADSALNRPVDYRDVLATIYHNLGFGDDVAIKDISGRRIGVLPTSVRPVVELI
jgi:uncharacterized protein DUF1501